MCSLPKSALKVSTDDTSLVCCGACNLQSLSTQDVCMNLASCIGISVSCIVFVGLNIFPSTDLQEAIIFSQPFLKD